MPTKIITRSEALAKGLRFFFTGKPCKHGHVALRQFLGQDGVCSECRKLITARWRDANREQHNSWNRRNPESHRAATKRYDEVHPERHRKSQMDWLNRNRQQHRVYQNKLNKRRRQNDPNYRLHRNLHGRLYKAVRRGDGLKSGKTLELVGCTVAELRTHLEALFASGMDWSNYGHGPGKWNIDHIVPCASFDLTDPVQQ